MATTKAAGPCGRFALAQAMPGVVKVIVQAPATQGQAHQRRAGDGIGPEPVAGRVPLGKRPFRGGCGHAVIVALYVRVWPLLVSGIVTPPDITDNAAKSLSDRELLEAIYAAIQKAERIWSALQNGNGIGAWRAARKVKP